MRLETLRLANFRSCVDTTLTLSENLTLLVGENDAGKSNLMDAVRISVPPVTGRSTLWFDTDRDLSYGVLGNASIVIKRTYADLTVSEDAFYTPALVDDHRKLVHTTEYFTDFKLARRYRIKQSVGESCIADPEPENRDRVAHVYLPPLRDSAAALSSSGGNRLAEIIRVIASQEEIVEFENKANESLKALAHDAAARKVVNRVQNHLTAVTQPVRHRIVDVQHQRQRLSALARSLRLHMAAYGFSPSDLSGSGLGYLNLLFIATVILELERASDFDLLLLLLEEPEAHLHPQLQSVLLSYLEDQALKSCIKDIPEGEPAGRIQIIASTHSPHLASSVSTRDIVVVRSRSREVDELDSETSIVEAESISSDGSINEETPLVSGVSMVNNYPETFPVSLGAMVLSESERRKVDRYLDATKASLLFARQVILVEGVAESLLIRCMAERIVFPENRDALTLEGMNNRRMREQFRAITVVPIGGVDFVPYLKLLLHDDEALVDRVVVITDGDSGAGELRRGEISAAFMDHVNSGCLSIFVGGTTLEAELFASPDNEAVLREAFRSQHPRSLGKWDDLMPDGDGTPLERAEAFSAALKSGSLELGKGDFAHVVAEILIAGDVSSRFHVPEYLIDAIKSATIMDEPGVGDDIY